MPLAAIRTCNGLILQTVVDQETALRDHQAVEYRLRVPEGESELRVTLAYTDPPTTARLAIDGDFADNKHEVACGRPKLLLSYSREDSGV